MAFGQTKGKLCSYKTYQNKDFNLLDYIYYNINRIRLLLIMDYFEFVGKYSTYIGPYLVKWRKEVRRRIIFTLSSVDSR